MPVGKNLKNYSEIILLAKNNKDLILIRKDLDNILTEFGTKKGIKFFVGNIKLLNNIASINISASFKEGKNEKTI